MDIATMTPPKGKGKAKPAAKGTSGSALGALLIRQAEATAEAEVKLLESRKDTLRRIEKFTREDHLAFRAELNGKLEVYKMAAETEGMTLSAFQQSDPKVNSVTVTVSMWRKFSEAIEAGFKPEYDQPWAYVSQKATVALLAKANTHTGTTESPSTAAPTTKKQRGRPGKTNVEKGLDLLAKFPAQDLETIGKWIASKLGHAIPFEAIKK